MPKHEKKIDVKHRVGKQHQTNKTHRPLGHLSKRQSKNATGGKVSVGSRPRLNSMSLKIAGKSERQNQLHQRRMEDRRNRTLQRRLDSAQGCSAPPLICVIPLDSTSCDHNYLYDLLSSCGELSSNNEFCFTVSYNMGEDNDDKAAPAKEICYLLPPRYMNMLVLSQLMLVCDEILFVTSSLDVSETGTHYFKLFTSAFSSRKVSLLSAVPLSHIPDELNGYLKQSYSVSEMRELVRSLAASNRFSKENRSFVLFDTHGDTAADSMSGFVRGNHFCLGPIDSVNGTDFTLNEVAKSYFSCYFNQWGYSFDSNDYQCAVVTISEIELEYGGKTQTLMIKETCHDEHDANEVNDDNNCMKEEEDVKQNDNDDELDENDDDDDLSEDDKEIIHELEEELADKEEKCDENVMLMREEYGEYDFMENLSEATAYPEYFKHCYQFENYSWTNRQLLRYLDDLKQFTVPSCLFVYKGMVFVRNGSKIRIKISGNGLSKHDYDIINLSSLFVHEMKPSMLQTLVTNDLELVDEDDKYIMSSGFTWFPLDCLMTTMSKQKQYFTGDIGGKTSINLFFHGPVMFKPVPVLIFQLNDDGNVIEYIECCSLATCDPSVQVFDVKKLIGRPSSSKKYGGRRKIVVSDMFGDRGDVDHFQSLMAGREGDPKPMVLRAVGSKSQMTQGFIEGAVGTHGNFKAEFCRPINNDDRIEMIIYKRIFPIEQKLLSMGGATGFSEEVMIEA